MLFLQEIEKFSGNKLQFSIYPPSLIDDLDIKLKYSLMKLWAEQFLRIDLHQKEKEEK